MSFHPATFNLTVLGPAARKLSNLQGNIRDFTPRNSGIHITPHTVSIIDATEKQNLDSILDPLQSRLDSNTSPVSISKGARNFLRDFRNRKWRESNLNKRSHQTKATQTPTVDDQSPNTNTIPPPNMITGTDDGSFSTNGTNSSATTSVHNGGHVSLMDTRSPEHADLFESSRVRGPLTVRVTTLPTTESTTTTTETTTSPTPPQVVTPRMSLPIPSKGALMQLPILWTALSLALGVEVQGEIIRGLPCIKRLNQLFCRNAGTSYPSDNIESFIDNNKALTRRMYGDFQSELGLGEIIESAIRSARRGRSVDDIPGQHHPVANMIPNDITEAMKIFGKEETMHLWGNLHETDHSTAFNRTRRQAGGANRRPPASVPRPPSARTSNSDRLDSCNSKMEIVTPYWASNSAGKILAIVNLKEFSQVIHQEVCTKSSTRRCNGECGCEQKYKWHRMLAYDLENECKGIFVDWFLFPSCCVCRCDP